MHFYFWSFIDPHDLATHVTAGRLAPRAHLGLRRPRDAVAAGKGQLVSVASARAIPLRLHA